MYSRILLVEDSDEDYETTRRGLKEAGINNSTHRCEDGDEAIAYLTDIRDNQKDKPGVVLLDLNLPGTGGIEVIQFLKSDDYLKTIPIVVLTTSSDHRDIEKCYGSGANSYIQKPVNFDNFMEAIKRLKEYWFEISILPKQR